jgi:hypothetical protein
MAEDRSVAAAMAELEKTPELNGIHLRNLLHHRVLPSLVLDKEG